MARSSEGCEVVLTAEGGTAVDAWAQWSPPPRLTTAGCVRRMVKEADQDEAQRARWWHCAECGDARHHGAERRCPACEDARIVRAWFRTQGWQARVRLSAGPGWCAFTITRVDGAGRAQTDWVWEREDRRFRVVVGAPVRVVAKALLGDVCGGWCEMPALRVRLTEGKASGTTRQATEAATRVCAEIDRRWPPAA